VGTWKMITALGAKAHFDALTELVTITVISISPLLLGGLIRWLQIGNSILSFASYEGAVDSFLARGELFLYALAFIAIIAWTALREWPLGLRPPRVVLGLFCLISISIITIFCSLDAAKVALHIEMTLKLSKIMFVITLAFYYLATVLSKIEPPDLAAILSESSSALASKLGPGAS
jgi:hypothetical protein